MDLYAVLGVERDSTLAKIRAAFRTRAKDLHPDSGGSDESFAKLNSAYMVLRDKDRRKKYDETGEVDEKGVDNDLKILASMLLALFDSAVKEGLADRTELDVIKLMRKFVADVIEKKELEVKEINKELVAVKALAKRISSKDKRNLLGDVIDRKRKTLESSLMQFRQELRSAKMLSEELENYSCLVEVAQMVGAYFLGEPMPVSLPSF